MYIPDDHHDHNLDYAAYDSVQHTVVLLYTVHKSIKEETSWLTHSRAVVSHETCEHRAEGEARLLWSVIDHDLDYTIFNGWGVFIFLLFIFK